VGTGSAGPDLSRDAGDPAEIASDYIRKCRRNAGHLRHAAGRLAVPASRSFFPENLRSDNLLRNGLSTCERATVVHRARFNFMTEARIWYSRDPDQQLLPGECQNMVVLSEEFYREVQNHPIPTDLEAAKALSASPAVLDLFTWLSSAVSRRRGASVCRSSASSVS